MCFFMYIFFNIYISVNMTHFKIWNIYSWDKEEGRVSQNLDLGPSFDFKKINVEFFLEKNDKKLPVFFHKLGPQSKILDTLSLRRTLGTHTDNLIV